MEPLTNAKSFEKARRLWDKAIPRTLTLEQACQVCYECQDLTPFTFNNGNTFAAIGRPFIEDSLKHIPPVEAQIIRTTVCHFIGGLIGRRELQQVLEHFEVSLDLAARPSDPVARPNVPA